MILTQEVLLLSKTPVILIFQNECYLLQQKMSLLPENIAHLRAAGYYCITWKFMTCSVLFSFYCIVGIPSLNLLIPFRINTVWKISLLYISSYLSGLSQGSLRLFFSWNKLFPLISSEWLFPLHSCSLFDEFEAHARSWHCIVQILSLPV